MAEQAPGIKGSSGRALARVNIQGDGGEGSLVWDERGLFFEPDGTISCYATPSAPGIEPPRFRY